MAQMKQINIKPLSVNQAWQGRRFKTSDCKIFELSIWHKLPRRDVPKKGKLLVHYQFGLSNKGADFDNCIKVFQDILQKKYDFNDSRIYRAIIDKVDVEKGEEFIRFKIEKL